MIRLLLYTLLIIGGYIYFGSKNLKLTRRLMVKTVLTILLFAHVIGCSSAVLGYVIGTASNLTSDLLIRQLQSHDEDDKRDKEK